MTQINRRLMCVELVSVLTYDRVIPDVPFVNTIGSQTVAKV